MSVISTTTSISLTAQMHQSWKSPVCTLSLENWLP